MTKDDDAATTAAVEAAAAEEELDAVLLAEAARLEEGEEEGSADGEDEESAASSTKFDQAAFNAGYDVGRGMGGMPESDWRSGFLGGIREAAKEKAVEFAPGVLVIVLNRFRLENTTPDGVTTRMGQRGVVWEVDTDGDAWIKFADHDEQLMVEKKHFKSMAAINLTGTSITVNKGFKVGDPEVEIKEGQKGVVDAVDNEGDALVNFEDNELLVWVRKDQMDNLEVNAKEDGSSDEEGSEENEASSEEEEEEEEESEEDEENEEEEDEEGEEEEENEADTPNVTGKRPAAAAAGPGGPQPAAKRRRAASQSSGS